MSGLSGDGRSLFLDRPSPSARGASRGSGSLSNLSLVPLSSPTARRCTPNSPSSTLSLSTTFSSSSAHFRIGTSNPVQQVATKLNEMTQVLFVCGTPRADDTLLDEVEVSLYKTRRQQHHHHDRPGHDSWSIFNNSEDEASADDGIEVDTENSLRPAYELCRV